nr:integrase, catalytic region, zinc finger, CCHC-type, peptidase aspartic, catalytic [Tanacetum cinerariifolium]
MVNTSLKKLKHHLASFDVDTFYNALTPNDQDALDSAAGGNFLDKIPRECLSIIESKSKVRYSRSRVTDVRANANAPLPSSCHSNSIDLQQIAASLEDKLDIRMNRFEKSLNEMKNSFITPTAPLKAVTEKQDDFQNQMMQFMQNLYNKPSTSSSLPSNIIPNPKGEAKAITTRSGMSYKEPPIAPPGMSKQEPVEVTTDTKPPNSNDIHPPTVQVEVQVDKPAEEPSVVVQIVLWYLDSGRSKHMTGDCSQLINFVHKFLDTVKFGNDHVAKIMGYDDYKIGNVMISRVYFVEGLGHNLFSEKLYLLHMDLYGLIRTESIMERKYILVIVDNYFRFTWVKFLRSKDEAPDFIIKFLKMIQVRIKVSIRRIRTNNGTEFVNQTLREYYKQIGISHETSVAHSPQQNEAVATACYTQNRSIVCLHHGKTPYELLHGKLPDLSFLYVFGALCYPTNDSECRC